MTSRARRAQQVTQVVLDVPARHPELARERGDRARLVGEQVEQVLAERHATIIANGYTARMRSVADNLSRELRETAARLTPQERIDLMLSLGDEAVAVYRAAHDVSDATARACLAASRHTGRQPSCAARP
jgi:hypothetical protein